jgi:hypothetical protein
MRALILAREVWRQHSTGLLRTVFQTWSEHGWRALVARGVDAFRRRPIDEFYPEWVRRYDDTLTEQARERMRAEIAGWPAAPVICVAMPIRSGDPRWLAAAIESVRDQLYPRWELCICADAAIREARAGRSRRPRNRTSEFASSCTKRPATSARA